MALTNKDAAIILGMVARGDKKHDIAAWFGENQARIKEVEDGAFGGIAMAKPDELFPKGAPGPKGRRLKAFVNKAIAELDAGNAAAAKKLLEEGLAMFDKHQL